LESTVLSSLDLGVVVAYMLGMLGIGYYVYQKAPSFEEYLVAGRSMTTPILVCTLASTYYGLDVLFGTSELAYNEGLVAFFAYTVLSLGLYFIAALVLPGKLHAEKFTSLPEILERNYGLTSGVLGAGASFFYSIPAIQLFALGRICEVVFGVEAWTGALVLGLIALAYTLLGGLWAVAITDTVQFVLMMITLAIGIPLLMGNVGGFDQVAEIAPDGYFALLGAMPFWLMVAYVATNITVLVDPGFYQRVFGAKSGRQARNAMLIAIGIWFAYDWLVTAGGMLAAAAVASGDLPADLHSNDALMAAMSLALPSGLLGIFVAGVLATAMSTIDSYTLVAGAIRAYDIYRPLRNPGASDRELIRYTRMGIVLAWAAGFALAFLFDRVMALWVFMATGLSSMVLVPILMALFWKGRKVPLAGVLSSVSGLVSMIVYYVVVAQLGVENDAYGTYIWSVSIGGTTFDLWQEYALFFTLPASFFGFVVGTLLGRRASDHKEGSE